MQVQTRQWSCHDPAWSNTNKKASCNCAAVIRDYNDVIEFDCCNENMFFDKVTPLKKRIKSKGRLAHTTSIKQTNNGFNVMFTVSSKHKGPLEGMKGMKRGQR